MVWYCGREDITVMKKDKSKKDKVKHYFILDKRDNRPVAYTDYYYYLEGFLDDRNPSKYKIVSFDEDTLPEELEEYLDGANPLEIIPVGELGKVYTTLRDEEIAIDYLDNYLCSLNDYLKKLDDDLQYFKFTEEEQTIVRRGMASLEDFNSLFMSSFGPTEDEYLNYIDFPALVYCLMEDGIID